MAKTHPGTVARSLVEIPDRAGNPRVLAETLTGLGYRTELTGPPAPGRPWTLDVICGG